MCQIIYFVYKLTKGVDVMYFGQAAEDDMEPGVVVALEIIEKLLKGPAV